MKSFVFTPSCGKSLELISLISTSFTVQNVSIVEELKRKETPVKFIDRIIALKAESIENNSNCNTLVCHKSIFVGRTLIKTPESEEEIRQILKLYSGRNHDIHSAILLKRAANGINSIRRTVTRIKVKHLSIEEVDQYVNSGLWKGEIGGYNFDSIFQSFIIKAIGSTTGAQGLPLYEARNLINNI